MAALCTILRPERKQKGKVRIQCKRRRGKQWKMVVRKRRARISESGKND